MRHITYFILLILFLDTSPKPTRTSPSHNSQKNPKKRVASRKSSNQADGHPRLFHSNSFTEIKDKILQNKSVIIFSKKTMDDFEDIRNLVRDFTKLEPKILVILFDAIHVSEEEMVSLGINYYPSVDIFLSGYKRKYHGPLTVNDLAIWVDEILEAVPTTRDSISEIDKIDRHYFVFVEENTLVQFKEAFELIAKLISPLRIYTGFSESIIPDHFVLKAGVFRQYNQEIKELDLDRNYEQIANEIVSGEFPKVMNCNQQSLAIILDFKIPVLVFFERSNFNSTEREAVQQSVRNHSDYLLLLHVDFDKTDKCTVFMKNFLNAKNAPSLKILNLLKGVQRFNFVGQFVLKDVDFFLANYVSGNLKSFKLNQKLTDGESLMGIPLANFSVYKSSRKDFTYRFIFFVFDEFVDSLENDVVEFRKLRDLMKDQTQFKFYAIDHSKNDLDGFYNNALPFVFLVLKNGKYLVFEDEKIESGRLLQFVEKAVPEVKGKIKLDEDL